MPRRIALLSSAIHIYLPMDETENQWPFLFMKTFFYKEKLYKKKLFYVLVTFYQHIYG